MYAKYHINYSHISNPVSYNNTDLIQLGRCYCIPSGHILKHAHGNWYELTLVSDGEGMIITNGISRTVGKGDIYISCPGDFHEIKSSEKKPLHFDFFSFNTRNPEILKKLKNITGNMYDYNQRVIHDDLIYSYISNAIKEYPSGQTYNKEIMSLLFEQILFILIRNFDNIPKQDIKNKPLSSEELCFHIMHYIDTHIYVLKNLYDLSDKFSYNYSYLSNLYKKTTGNTILEYYHNRRLDTAKLLIKEGNFTISAISEKLNYSTLYAFSKAFKKKYGVAPKHYANKFLTQK